MMSILRVLLLGLFSSLAMAETQPADIAAKLAPQFQQLDSLHGEFSQQRHIGILSLPLQSNGIFSYQRGKGMVWETLAPVQNRVEITPEKGILMANAGQAEQAVIAPPVLAQIFLNLFAGDFSQLETLFTIAALPQEPTAAHQWGLVLTPKDTHLGEQISSIQVQGSMAVDSITLSETNGDSTAISLKVLTQKNE